MHPSLQEVYMNFTPPGVEQLSVCEQFEDFEVCFLSPWMDPKKNKRHKIMTCQGC